MSPMSMSLLPSTTHIHQATRIGEFLSLRSRTPCKGKFLFMFGEVSSMDRVIVLTMNLFCSHSRDTWGPLLMLGPFFPRFLWDKFVASRRRQFSYTFPVAFSTYISVFHKAASMSSMGGEGVRVLVGWWVDGERGEENMGLWIGNK